MADENVPGDLVKRLRAAGHDVLAMTDLKPSSSDEQVIERSVAEDRVLITFDKGFGEKVVRLHLNVPGLILLRRTGRVNPVKTIERIASMLESGTDWRGQLSTVTSDGRVRMRPIKGRSQTVVPAP